MSGMKALVAALGKTCQQFETSNVKKAGDLKASHADPLVRLQPYRRTSLISVRIMFPVLFRKVKGYRYIL